MSSPSMFSPVVLFSIILFYYVSAEIAPLGKPYFDSVPVPPVTPSPININIQDTQQIFRLPRFTFIGTNNKTGIMQNTGKEIFLTPISSKGSFTTGGVLGFDKFNLYGMRFIWNSSLGPAASVVNGRGTPLEVNFIFQNSKYHSFQNSLLHRDGIVICSTRIIVGGDDNPDFKPAIPYLQALIPYNSKVAVPEAYIFTWIVVHFRLEYISYAGAYRNFTTGEEYYCATYFVNSLLNPKSPSISLAQFQSTFGLLQDASGKPYDNALQAVDSTGTPIVRTGPAFLILTSQ